MLARDFGTRLRSLREQRGLTQRELAVRLQTRVPQISRYETGAFMPNAETLLSLADALGVNVDTLLGRTNGNEPASNAVKDIRLVERLRELEKLDRRYRDTAIAVIDAIVLQGSQEALSSRLSKRSDADRRR
jgi:transcriptional regulator with XRE-family HTH domain